MAFTKISSPIFTDTLKMYLAYALTVAYSPSFSSPIAFTCVAYKNLPPPNISCVRYVMVTMGLLISYHMLDADGYTVRMTSEVGVYTHTSQSYNYFDKILC